jgi:hypothetical protein
MKVARKKLQNLVEKAVRETLNEGSMSEGRQHQILKSLSNAKYELAHIFLMLKKEDVEDYKSVFAMAEELTRLFLKYEAIETLPSPEEPR